MDASPRPVDRAAQRGVDPDHRSARRGRGGAHFQVRAFRHRQPGHGTQPGKPLLRGLDRSIQAGVPHRLKELQGKIQYVNVGVYPESAVPEVRRGIEAAGGTIVDEWGNEGSYRPGYRSLIVEVDAQNLLAIASLPSVRWLEYQSPILTADDERSAQIVAENLNGVAPPNTAPVTGYQAALTGLGLSGAGVVVGRPPRGGRSCPNPPPFHSMKPRRLSIPPR